MTTPEPPKEIGHCIGCDRDNKLGWLINEVNTNSGAGWTNVQCEECRRRGRGLRPEGPTTPRRHSL